MRRDRAILAVDLGEDKQVDGGFSSHGGAKSITDALAKAHPDSW